MSRFRSSPHAGFGLIELMISMVLGLLVLGAAIAVFQSNQRTFNANEGQNRIQEGARAAYEICLLYTSPSPRDRTRSRMPSSA